MKKITIGNDIVDLKTQEPRLHERFVERVFSLNEQAFIKNDLQKLWLCWAAKEAAYKAVRRIDLQAVFSPVKFEVNLEAEYVQHKDHRLYYSVISTSDYVHLICANESEFLTSKNLYSWVDSSDTSTHSVTIRNIAIERIAALMQVTEAAVSITPPTVSGKPPLVLIDGAEIKSLISLSHHGRFLACSFLNV